MIKILFKIINFFRADYKVEEIPQKNRQKSWQSGNFPRKNGLKFKKVEGFPTKNDSKRLKVDKFPEKMGKNR